MSANPIIFFSKHFGKYSVEQLIDTARKIGVDGWDLACRPGHTVSPENVKTALPKCVKQMRAAGLDIPMITANFDLLEPTHPTAEPILAAMNEANVRLIKLGYFLIDNKTQDYWERVSYIRTQFEGWTRLAEKHNVRICYHTHSGSHLMGNNAAAVMHLVNGFDPRRIGVYLDPAHLLFDGEHPEIAVNMVRHYLAIVGLKDARKAPSPINYGFDYVLCRAGHGDVDWPTVFDCLKRVNFAGPLTVHAEYERHLKPDAKGEKPTYLASLPGEVTFFRHLRDGQRDEIRI